MRWDDLFRVSFRQVIRQRRRNLGVVLTIALGTAALIIVVTMSQDFKKNLNKDLELLGGATLIKAYFQKKSENPDLLRAEWFREQTVSALRRIPGVNQVSEMITRPNYASVTMGQQVYRIPQVGVDEYYWSVNSFTPESGRFFQKKEVDDRLRVCVIGVKAAHTVFGHTDVVGRLMSVGLDLYRIIGVLGGLGLGDLDEWIFVPLTTAKDRMPGDTLTRTVFIRCLTWDDVAPVAEAVPRVVQARQTVEGFKLKVGWERLKLIKRVVWWVEFFVYISIFATLVLGGFGIWNIMTVSVRNRTREIGLKKAMGAEDRDILAQFLTESLTLSLIAAIIGVGVGRLGVEVAAFLLKSRPPENTFLICVLLGLIFALFLGVGAGLTPSLKASRMEVVTAVRYE